MTVEVQRVIYELVDHAEREEVRHEKASRALRNQPSESQLKASQHVQADQVRHKNTYVLGRAFAVSQRTTDPQRISVLEQIAGRAVVTFADHGILQLICINPSGLPTISPIGDVGNQNMLQSWLRTRDRTENRQNWTRLLPAPYSLHSLSAFWSGQTMLTPLCATLLVSHRSIALVSFVNSVANASCSGPTLCKYRRRSRSPQRWCFLVWHQRSRGPCAWCRLPWLPPFPARPVHSLSCRECPARAARFDPAARSAPADSCQQQDTAKWTQRWPRPSLGRGGCYWERRCRGRCCWGQHCHH